MSNASFASITSALFVRKGEAAPSVVAAKPRPMPVRETRAPVRHAEPVQHVPVSADHKRRVVITLSAEEFVRLGIAAAKKNSTRHDLVREALFEQLDAFARDCGRDCACIASGEPCQSESPERSAPPVRVPLLEIV